MNYENHDIRFPSKFNIALLKGKLITREDLINTKNDMIIINNASFAIARRILIHTSIEVLKNNNWINVRYGKDSELEELFKSAVNDLPHKIVETTIEEPVAVECDIDEPEDYVAEPVPELNEEEQTEEVSNEVESENTEITVDTSTEEVTEQTISEESTTADINNQQPTQQYQKKYINVGKKKHRR